MDRTYPVLLAIPVLFTRAVQYDGSISGHIAVVQGGGGRLSVTHCLEELGGPRVQGVSGFSPGSSGGHGHDDGRTHPGTLGLVVGVLVEAFHALLPRGETTDQPGGPSVLLLRLSASSAIGAGRDMPRRAADSDFVRTSRASAHGSANLECASRLRNASSYEVGFCPVGTGCEGSTGGGGGGGIENVGMARELCTIPSDRS